jgi:energy-coupling factor transport system ATP-binding protein
MIEFRDFSFQYPQSQCPVLQDVNLQIQPGTLTLVAGPSGSGKSTLLRCLNGLVPHFTGGRIQGSITVDNSSPIQNGPIGMADKVGFVFQEPETQFVFDIVEDEIAFSLENQGMVRSEMKARLDQVCGRMGLEKIRHRSIATLSGGEKQKVAIASALVLQPEILALDEPTSQLDPAGADEMLKYIVSLKESLGLTIIIAEHRLERLLAYTDRMIYLADEGRILEGTPPEILSIMANVPPIIQIARTLNLSPFPVTPEEFPKLQIRESQSKNTSHPIKSGPASLEVKDLKVHYGNQVILNDVSLSLRKGEILILMGSNGAGKTTLLRAIMGLVPSTGTRKIGYQDLDAQTLSDIIKTIAYLPQDPNDLLFADSVIDEMRITLTNHNLPVDDLKIRKHLSFFDLQDKSERYPRDLSVGERQRTALAAITVHKPAIILLDEPTRGMDYENKSKLGNILKNWRSNGKSILVVTHDIEFAAQLADRVMLIERGEIMFTGSPQKAFTQFPAYQTQTSVLFPTTSWYKPEDLEPSSL